MNARHSFAIRLTVRSPFLFRGLAAGPSGVDASHLRNAQGALVAPADQIRGVLREGLADLAAVSGGSVISDLDIATLFGGVSPDSDGTTEQNRPNRGQILFGDLVATTFRRGPNGSEEAFSPAEQTTRVEINDETGAAERGHLQVVELAVPFGAEATFAGEFVAFWADDRGPQLAAVFDKAIKLLPAIGAFKSPGFGEVIAERSGVNIHETVPLAPANPESPAPTRVGYRVRFDRPILVDARRVVENCFSGSSIVPGAVFKGALARRLELAGEDPTSGTLGDALAVLSVSHAFPEDQAGRRSGLPLPLSIVAAETEDGAVRVGDALGGAIGRGAMLGESPAVFALDWKEKLEREARRRLDVEDFIEPPPEPRTHTAIRAGNVPEDQQLFTTIARSNLRPWKQEEQRCWFLIVDTSGVADRRIASRLLAVIESGLDGVGRTGVTTQFERAPVEEPSVRPFRGDPSRFAVVLETPAVLFDPRQYIGKDLADAYTEYWKTVCPGGKLVDFVASQELAGGYLGMRRRLYGRQVSYPFVLTTPGSVFLLEGAVPDSLKALVQTGLPVPAFDGRVPDWRACPYVPQNGYGRFSADYLSDPAVASRLDEVTHV